MRTEVIPMTVGDRIKLTRTQKGLTQDQLAECAGVSKQAIYKYENNIVTNIPGEKLAAIAKRLGVSPAYLMGWAEETQDPAAQSRGASDDELKFALFGGGPVTDAQFEEVRQFARFIKERDANGGKK